MIIKIVCHVLHVHPIYSVVVGAIHPHNFSKLKSPITKHNSFSLRSSDVPSIDVIRLNCSMQRQSQQKTSEEFNGICTAMRTPPFRKLVSSDRSHL